MAGVTLAFRDDAGIDAREALATAELRIPFSELRAKEKEVAAG